MHAQAILYLCCQSLFKYLPYYDKVYPLIAKEVADCRFLFISHHSHSVTEQFRQRLYKVFKRFNLNADDYVVVLPILDPGKYHALNLLSSVYLDTTGWSGCNSTFEAIACNLPVITLPGELMRARHASAILNMMDVTENHRENN